MHKYFKSAGFSKYNKRSEVNEMLDKLQDENSKNIHISRNKDGELLWELYAKVSENIGVCISGYIDEKKAEFIRERYFPYLHPQIISSKVNCNVYKFIDYDQYSVLLDDSRLGISLIYRLINNIECISREYKNLSLKVTSSYISAWADEAKILLPTFKTFEQSKQDKEALINRDMLIEAAKDGDEFAIESLSEEDFLLYEMATNRLIYEDIYSIVESCIVPQGVECDVYSIVGDITDFSLEENVYTKEGIYIFNIDCKDIELQLAIPKVKLEGEAKIGRRIKAKIWMQGIAEFGE